MHILGRRLPLSLLLALLAYLVLAAVTVNAVGVVGETAIGWALGRAPAVMVQADPILWAAGDQEPTAGNRLGPLVASQVRPIESLEVGPLALPLAVNTYTGGLPDWPARLLFAASGSVGAVGALHVLLGAAVLVGVHRFLRLHGTDVAAALAALVLATDWSFVFYKKVLGGTEIALQAAVVLVLWGLWDRRWSAGRHGLLRLGLGVGLGLCAKATFGVTLAALLLTALLMRWDKPTLGPPAPQSWWRPLALVGLLVSPLALGALHHWLLVPAEPHVTSHDYFGVQWQRVLTAVGGGRTPVREDLSNLAVWAGQPLAFFARAYGAVPAAGWTPLRAIGLVVAGAGVSMAWTDRHPTPHVALLRFCGLFLFLQVGLLLLVARDLHHLAQAAPTLAITIGLALSRLAGLVASPRAPRHRLLAAALALPLMADGAWQLARTDATVDTIAVPTFTRQGQADLLALLQGGEVRRLVVCDYETYGVFETLAPGLEVVHGWGAASRRRGGVLPALLRQAEGAHFLVVQASAPMIYNLAPGPLDLENAARSLGLAAREVGRLSEGRAVLYAVEGDPAQR